MISVLPELSLQPVTLKEQEKLFDLMMKIYRPVYQHLWFDDGSSYVSSQFNRQNLKLELSETNASYYFVYFKEALIGLLRFLKDCKTQVIEEPHTTKLHRIYLDPSVHGQGIGKALMQWLIKFSISQDQQSIWLECMDTQLSAYNFYKHLGFKTVDTFRLDSPSMRSERRGMLLMQLPLDALN